MNEDLKRDRTLERALVFNFVIHGVGLLAMVTLLLPFLPGGTAHVDVDRIARIAAHPWQFRLGWLPWQLCAVADLWLAIAMVRTPWLSRAGAIAVLVFTLCAVIPDQYAQAEWITRGVALACVNPRAYLAFEHAIFPLTAVWGAMLYTLAALGWTWCFARAGTWSRALSVLSVTTWSAMAVAVIAPLAQLSADFTAAANALGFVQLQLWLALVAEQVLRRARPFVAHGRYAYWRHPHRAWLNVIANSRLLRALCEPLPFLAIRSDITHVVYVNYLIPAAQAAALVPPGLELQRLGPTGAHALFTFLTYQHGHFGFSFLRGWRKWMPSPVQSNWRLHVLDPRTGHRGIYFVTNAITDTLPAIAARLTTEGTPLHVLRAGNVTRVGHALTVSLDPGAGTAPDAELLLHVADAPSLTGAWAECFTNWRGFLAYCVPQDRALASQPGQVSRQEIDLGISLDACVPLAGAVASRAATLIAGEHTPLCFYVPRLSFAITQEAHDR